MNSAPHFYAVIIGTEILNGRRQDKHFTFVKEALLARGHTLFASLVIKDDARLIEQIFTLVAHDPLAVLFSFGGIGSTPDDLTRQIAADIFTGLRLERHPEFEQAIIERFGEEAYPHRIHMSDLPHGAQLLKNPVNNMSGFYLDEHYFFVPGFPEMGHPMIIEALERFYPEGKISYRRTLRADTGENTLIALMQALPESVELSSLPMINNNHPNVDLSLSGDNEEEVNAWFQRFVDYLEANHIGYTHLD
jgi:molybdopterin-biosynthesis enzyme MoeA-like protein